MAIVMASLLMVLLSWSATKPARADRRTDNRVTALFLAPAVATPGETIDLTLELINETGQAVFDLRVQVTLNGRPLDPAGVNFTPPDLHWTGTGSRWKGVQRYQVKPSDLPGPLVFAAKVTGSFGTIEFPGTVELNLAETVHLAALDFVKKVEGAKEATIALGDEVEYTFELRNLGSLPLNHITINDPDIAFVTSLGDSPLAPTSSTLRTVTAPKYRPTASDFDTSGKFVNTAEVTAKYTTDVEFGQPTGEVLARDSATLFLPAPTPTPDLSVTKTVDDPAPQEGQVVTFTVTVTNEGPGNMRAVSLLDKLPDGLTYSGHRVSRGNYHPDSGDWDVGGLAEGAQATLTLEATVNAGTAPHPLTNTARLVDSDPVDGHPGNNRASATVTPWAPGDQDGEPEPEPDPDPEPEGDKPSGDPLVETDDPGDGPTAPPLPRTGGNSALLTIPGLLALGAGLYGRRRWS